MALGLSLIGDTASHLGHELSADTHKVLAAVEKSPAFIANLIKRHAPHLMPGGGGRGGAHPQPTYSPLGQVLRPAIGGGSGEIPESITGAIQQAEVTGDYCAAGGKPWTITSTISIAAGALAADTDLGATTNPFASANSGFFTTTGVFPQPFVSFGIAGMITAQIPASETEFASVLDSMYLSVRATTELARFSLTRDLGFGICKESPLATSGVACALLAPQPMKMWKQFFDPRTTYTWGLRVPKAVTTVAAISVTLILGGLLFEGGAVGVQRH